MRDVADQFVELACLTYGDDESRARRREASELLVAAPDLVDAGVNAAAAAGDLDALRRHLDREPASPREPMLALCFSRVRQVDALGCLDLLLARDGDPNAFVMIGECRFTALTGVMGEGEAGPFEQPPHPHARAMAERLLDAGADPNDAQGLYDTHFLPDNAWLELLLARGLSVELEFLLGQAATQGFGERVDLLLAHGTAPDGRNRYNRRTHLENALLEGHAGIAARLVAASAGAPALSEADQFQVAVLANDAATARRILAASPSVAARPEALLAAARHGRLDALAIGLDLGLPIDGRDAGGLTPLHHAARAGHLDVVRELVGRGASLTVRDPLYDGTPLGHARHFATRWPHPHIAEVVAFLESAAQSTTGE